MTPGANDYYGWDWRQSRLINGDDGGNWNPSSPIVVGGSGLQLASAASKILGGLTTRLGGRLQLGPTDVIGLSPPRMLTRMIDLLSMPPSNIKFAPAVNITKSGLPFAFPSDSCFGTFPPSASSPGVVGIVPLDVNLSQPITFTIPTAWILNGRFLASLGVSPIATNATLASVTLNFRCGLALASLPASMMQVVPGSAVSPTLPPIGANLLNVAFGPGTISAWLPIGVYTAGQYVIPQGNRAAPFSYFKAIITSGPSGVSNIVEPNWNLTPGSITVDTPSLSWLCIGPSGDLYAPDPASLFDQGNAQSVTAAMDPAISGNIDESTNFITVTITNPIPGAVFMSLQFTFTDVTEMLWT